MILERMFQLKMHNTNLRTELIAGITTFMTMSYIIFVQPAILSVAGMDFGAVMVATCIASALATLLMGLLANYPIALAPAMGHNIFFVYTVCLSLGIPWQIVLGANFISGAVFIITSVFAFREKIINAVPASLKHAIAVGIGLLIALIGLEWSGIVVAQQGTFIGLGDLKSAPCILAIFGTLFIAALLVKRIKGAVLLGILATAILGLMMGVVRYQGLVSRPPSILPTFMKLDIAGIFTKGINILSVIFVLFFLDLFDTVGTLIGVGEQAGFIDKQGKLPRAKQALLCDAMGTVSGTMLGTSTVTSYIESAVGIASGGRTGLSNIFTALLFLLALVFYPLAKMIGGGYQGPGGVLLYPVIAPALIIVGSMMLANVTKINWQDYTESIPSFITLLIMPVTFSITEGIAFGFISYSLLKLISGKRKDVHWVIYVFSGLFVLRYIFLK